MNYLVSCIFMLCMEEECMHLYVWGNKMLCGVFVFQSVIDKEESFKWILLSSFLFCFLLLSLLQMDALEAVVLTHACMHAHTHTHTHTHTHKYTHTHTHTHKYTHTHTHTNTHTNTHTHTHKYTKYNLIRLLLEPFYHTQ